MEFNKSNNFNYNENDIKRETYYIANCDNGCGVCEFSEHEYNKWNEMCAYARDGKYCSADFKKIEKETDSYYILKVKESKGTCMCCDNKTAKKISINCDKNGNNITSFYLCDSCLTKLTKEFINYYITNEN